MKEIKAGREDVVERFPNEMFNFWRNIGGPNRGPPTFKGEGIRWAGEEQAELAKHRKNGRAHLLIKVNREFVEVPMSIFSKEEGNSVGRREEPRESEAGHSIGGNSLDNRLQENLFASSREEILVRANCNPTHFAMFTTVDRMNNLISDKNIVKDYTITEERALVMRNKIRKNSTKAVGNGFGYDFLKGGTEADRSKILNSGGIFNFGDENQNGFIKRGKIRHWCERRVKKRNLSGIEMLGETLRGQIHSVQVSTLRGKKISVELDESGGDILEVCNLRIIRSRDGLNVIGAFPSGCTVVEVPSVFVPCFKPVDSRALFPKNFLFKQNGIESSLKFIGFISIGLRNNRSRQKLFNFRLNTFNVTGKLVFIFTPSGQRKGAIILFRDEVGKRVRVAGNRRIRNPAVPKEVREVGLE
uniref:Uncharacterized protein n=1 Tax=Cannabis sativa TaxID=3483 RepID=A0A803PJW2_CANSA